jgi:oligosaccharide repeat unit polymerase
VSLAAKIYQWVVEGPVSSRVYGANQFVYTSTTAIAVVGSSLFAVGCLLTMYGNTIRKARPLLLVDWALVVCIGFVNLVILGTRSEMIAAVVLFLWFRLRIGTKFHPGIVIGAIAGAAIVFVGVAQYRIKSVGAVQYPFIENLLVDTSSPTYLTSQVAALVPQHTGFYWGSTYLDSLGSMLPGFLSRALFGAPQGTGSMAYRQLTGFTDPSQSWSFSEPTEAYLNFGFIGVLVLAIAIGWIFARSYLWAVNIRSGQFGSYVYPLLISYLPLGLRSDALGQLKSIVYPLAIVAISIWLGRLVSNRSRMAPIQRVHESTIKSVRD